MSEFVSRDVIRALVDEVFFSDYATQICVEAATINPVEYVDLEELVSSCAGITDPLGQLQSWFSDVLSSTASWIVQAVTSAVSGIVSTIVNTVSGLISGLSDAISNLASTITSGFNQIISMIQQVVITPILQAIESAQSFISQLPGMIESIGSAINAALNTLSDLVSVLSERISELVSGFLSSIQGAINTVISGIQSAASSALSAIASIVNQVGSALSSMAESVQRALQSALESVGNFMAQIVKQVQDALSGLTKWLAETSKFFQSLFEELSKGVETVIQSLATLGETIGTWVTTLVSLFTTIQEALKKFLDTLMRAPEVIPEALRETSKFVWENIVKPSYEWLVNNVFKPIFQGISEITEKVSQGFEFITKTFEGFVNAILRLPEMLWSLLPEWLKDAIEAMRKAWESFVEGLEEFLKDPLGFIQKGFDWLAKQIWSLLPDWLKGAIEAIQKAWESFVEGLKEFLEDPLGFIKRGFDWLAKQIWSLLPDWLKGAIETIQKAWNRFVEGLKEFLEDPLGFIKRGFDWLAKQIWELLPDWMKEAIEKAKEFLLAIWDGVVTLFSEIIPSIWEQIQDFLKDPLGAISSALRTVYDTIAPIVMDTLVAFGNMVFGGLKLLATIIVNTVIAVGITVSSILRTAYEGLSSVVRKAFEEGFRLLNDAVKTIVESVRVPEDCPLGELEGFTGLILTMNYMGYMANMTADALGGVADTIISIQVGAGGEGSAKPLGVGILGRILARVRAKLTAIVRWMAETMKESAKSTVSAMMLATAFWNFEFMRYLFRPMWINYFRDIGADTIGFSFPGVGETIRIAQRYYPTKHGKDVLEKTTATLYFMGYPAWFYDHVTKPAKELYTKLVKEVEGEYTVTVKDRFEKDRTLPASPFFDIPTASEMCRMMVRDIFWDLDSFSKAMLMRGYVRHIAYMYYLLHFRYPSPERLWDFVVRGISGMLWYQPTEDDVTEAQDEAQQLGAYVPKAPTKLNFDSDTLFYALARYMKWHDYARFSWLPGFTSDNWMYTDLLADIPGKIDIRWMGKWGLFDFMAEKGIELKKPVAEFTKILDDNAVNEKVTMDLTMFCRLLQATGLHPYYVPIVAVAEMMNAVAEERTLLRTGLMDMYRYGASSYDAVEKLMEQFTIASFKVAYFDINKGDWVENKWINVPVMFLPAERKLLELRALIDRYMRIYRDFLKDVEAAYRESILEEKDAEKALTDMISVVNSYFPKVAKEITGSEVALSLDTDYIESALKSWAIERQVWTIRRIRRWVFRVLGWVFWRLAYGYVTPEDVRDVASTLAEISKLPDLEREAIETIIIKLANIAKKEYIPTPSQLATISEILPAARRYADLAFEARGVPPEWRPLWRQYIWIKPIIDDVKKVLSAAEDLCEYFIITMSSYRDFLGMLTKYGWEKAELNFLENRVKLLRWRRAYRELVGTPSELVTMAEYVPNARVLALAEVKKRIDALPVDDETKQFIWNMWKDYIRIKPVYDEVKREITELISDYANGLITWEDFCKLLEELKEWGIDEWEIESYKFIAYVRRMRYELRSSS